jgi:hypothetical protein
VYEEQTRVHENSIFVYKSPQANMSMMSRYPMIMSFCVVPVIAYFSNPAILCYYIFEAIYNPPVVALLRYYTTRIDLLPHSEQMVFHKTSYFGRAKRSIVDIKDLKHVENWKEVPYS